MVKYAVFVRILRVAQLHEPFFEPLFLIVSYRRTRENNLFMPYFCELSRHKGRGLESRRLSFSDAKFASFNKNLCFVQNIPL